MRHLTFYKALLASTILVSLELLPAIFFPTAAAQSHESSVSVDRERGIEFFKQNRFREAVASLQKAVKTDSQDYDGWYFLGLAQVKTNDLKGATGSVDKALKLRPNSVPAHTVLSYTLLLRNKLPDCIREAQATLNLEPRLADPHYFIGVARLRMDARKEAQAEAETAIKLNPDYGAAYLLKSQALVSFLGDAVVSEPDLSTQERQDRYGEAAEALQKYLQLNPESKDKQIWLDQLESLRMYSTSNQPNDGSVHSTKDVRVKAKVLSKPPAGYTEVARRNQIAGTVVLKAIFASDGRVKHILIIKGLPDGLTEQCIRAAQKIKFTPATIDGKPVSQYIQLEYTFSLY